MLNRDFVKMPDGFFLCKLCELCLVALEKFEEKILYVKNLKTRDGIDAVFKNVSKDF